MTVPRVTWVARKVQKLWRKPRDRNGVEKLREINGIELAFDTAVIGLRFFSVSYWAKDYCLHRYLNKQNIRNKRRRRIWRDNLIDGYCIVQLIVLVAMLVWFRWPCLNRFVAKYVLFEIYLNLFSIFFLPRQTEIGIPKPSDPPTAVNEPSTRVERSILLLFVNVLQVTLAFAIFYRIANPCILPSGAFWNAALVFGTVNTPPGIPSYLVAMQVFFDFLLVAPILASFVGQAGPFVKKS
jgi:hypothetical protein